jgi:hypothetical protein
MSSQAPANSVSHLLTQWTNRFETHKKKIAAEEKITEMKLGSGISYYIKHTAEHALTSSDKRRFILQQYKSIVHLIEELNKEKEMDNIIHLIERAKVQSERSEPSSRHSSLAKTKQLLQDFQNELGIFLEAQKQSQPSDEIKR